MPYNPIKIANEFLRLGREARPPVPMTPLKLIKLVYLAHGWSFPILGEPLCNEAAQAWQYGPVIPRLYNAVRIYRSEPIEHELPGDTDPQQLSADALALIEQVFERYGRLSAIHLSSLTHMAGTPWSTTWDRYGRNAVIPDEAIAQHFQELFQRAA